MRLRHVEGLKVRMNFLLALLILAVAVAPLLADDASAQTGDTQADSLAQAQQLQQEQAAKEAQAAQNRANAGYFAKGSKRVGLLVGLGNSFGQTYVILGLGIGYYIVNGLEVALDGEAWWGNSPQLYRLTPGVRYTFWQMKKVKPYVGAAYRSTWVTGGGSRFDSALGRAGIFYGGRGKTYVGLGVIAEKFLDCNNGDCTNIYPELLFAMAF